MTIDPEKLQTLNKLLTDFRNTISDVETRMSIGKIEEKEMDDLISHWQGLAAPHGLAKAFAPKEEVAKAEAHWEAPKKKEK
jgi:ribosomal protein L12E/L44/L45/RPP1/RPP2